MFRTQDSRDYLKPVPGVEQKTLVYGEKTLMTEFVLKAGADIPSHSHPHEQSGYLVKGHIRLSIGKDIHDVHPGDAWCIPGGVAHGARTIEDAVAVEVFSPVREDYLPG